MSAADSISMRASLGSGISACNAPVLKAARPALFVDSAAAPDAANGDLGHSVLRAVEPLAIGHRGTRRLVARDDEIHGPRHDQLGNGYQVPVDWNAGIPVTAPRSNDMLRETLQ